MDARERDHLADLLRLDFGEMPDDARYDDLVRLAADHCAASVAGISFVDERRQWFAASVGVTVRETDRASSFCAAALASGDDPFIVDDAALDTRFAASPLVAGVDGVRFYAGTPIVTSSVGIPGLVCILDAKPRGLTDREHASLRLVARLVAALLDHRERTRVAAESAAEREAWASVYRKDAARAREQLALVLRAGDLGLWELDLRSGTWTIDDREATMLGYAPDAARGAIADWPSLVHPDDRAGRDAALQRHLRGETPFAECTFRMRHRDGSDRWIHEHAVAARPDGEALASRIVGTHRDVTDRERTAREAAASRTNASAVTEEQRRLRLIADNIPAIVMYVDRDERYTFVNAHFDRVFGIDGASLIGRSVRSVWGDAVHGVLAPHMRLALGGQVSTFEAARPARGGLREFETNYVPDIDDDGHVIGFFAMTRDISDHKRNQQALIEKQTQLDALARVDVLTGLPNRRSIEEHAVDAVARTQRTKIPMSLMYLDVDGFKAINDRHGHAGGDAVLREFGERLRGAIRATDRAARYAGDEFLICLEGVLAVEDVEAVASKIIAAMRRPIEIDGASVPVTTSIGMAIHGGGAETFQQLARRADAALYAAKSQGRDRACLAPDAVAD